MKYIVLLFFLVGCSHSLTLNPKGCYSRGLVHKHDNESNVFKDTIITFGSESEVYLEKILENEKLECRKIKNMNYTFKQGALDSLVSLVPFINSKTLIIEYTLDE